MVNAWFNTAKHRILSGDLDLAADTIRVMLYDDGTGYTFDVDDIFVVDALPATHEATGGGYARQDIGSPTFAVDLAADRGEYDGADITFPTVPAQGGADITQIIIFEFITDDTASPLLAFIDVATGFPLTPNGGDINVVWDADGILHIT